MQPSNKDRPKAGHKNDPVPFARRTRAKKILMLCAALAVVTVGTFFATAYYGDTGGGIRFISRPPIFTLSWGPRDRFIVQSGINLVADRAPQAQAGNFIEFGCPFSASRISLRLFSWSWSREEYRNWRSNHPKKMPDKVPERTTIAVTSRADACVAPVVAVASI